MWEQLLSCTFHQVLLVCLLTLPLDVARPDVPVFLSLLSTIPCAGLRGGTLSIPDLGAQRPRTFSVWGGLRQVRLTAWLRAPQFTATANWLQEACSVSSSMATEVPLSWPVYSHECKGCPF